MSDHDIIYLRDRRDSPVMAPTLAANADSALSESNHRISNNLSLLASSVSLRAAAIARHGESLDADEAAAILSELSARIDTVGRLHRLLARQPASGPIEIREFLHERCAMLVSALAAPGQVELIDTGVGHCPVPSSQVLPVSLIVTEAVTNSLKYAHPTGVSGKLMVGCRRHPDGSLEVEVADDGVGLPEEFDFDSDGGLGSRSIRAMARQLGANARYEASAIGTVFRIRIPPVPAG